MISESISRLDDSRASLLYGGESNRVVQTHSVQRVPLTLRQQIIPLWTDDMSIRLATEC